MKVLPFLLIAAALPGFLERFTRETNSSAASKRGMTAFEKKDMDAAAAEFRRAAQLNPTGRNHFNHGTALLASGKRQQAAPELQKAINDPAVKADALYNRGTSSLGAKAWDDAIRDLSDVLRIRSNDMAAKRNLELALNKKNEEQQQQQQQQQGGGGGSGAEGGGGTSDKQTAGASGEETQKKQGGDEQDEKSKGKNPEQNKQQQAMLDSLLRAIQQQEGEELQRMKRAKSEGRRVGW